MIVDSQALEPKTVPEELQHRDPQIRQLEAALDPITSGRRGQDALITGPSGTGKTTIAQFVVRELKKTTFGVRSGYVNALSDSSRSRALWKLARDARVGQDLKPKGTHPSVFRDRLADLPEEDQFVAIIDEVHGLRDDTTLYDLLEMPHVTVILVTIDEDSFAADAESRLRDRLHAVQKLHLDRYEHHELTSILQKRVEYGLAPSAVANGVCEMIADIAAGDARHAIVLLRTAVEHVINQNDPTVRESHVEEVREEAKTEVRLRYLSDWGTQPRLLWEIIREHGPITGPDLKARYQARSNDPVADSTRRKYLGSFEGYEMIEQTGTSKGAEYRVPTAFKGKVIL